MWIRYHSIRCSTYFHQTWVEFLSNGVDKSCTEPSFYQHVTDTVFSKLINLQYTMTGDLELACKPNKKLTNIEENVLRYLAHVPEEEAALLLGDIIKLLSQHMGLPMPLPYSRYINKSLANHCRKQKDYKSHFMIESL